MTATHRLTALRHELDLRGLDGFVIPRADEHQGEYVPDCAMRLAWLTGFTGSAGIAVVLRDRAAIFVDGRYTLQVRAETDETLFEIKHLIDQPPRTWLDQALPKGARLGYDPWLHTAEQVKVLRDSCARAEAQLTACSDNPLDAVWTDRPAPPADPVFHHDLCFAGRSSQEKRLGLSDTLRAERLDAAVISDPESIAWLLNIRGSDVPYLPSVMAFAVVPADGSVDLFMNPAKVSVDSMAQFGGQIRLHSPAELPDFLAGLTGRIRIDRHTAPSIFSDILSEAGAVIDSGMDPCALPKACKNQTELAGARAAHLRDGLAMVRFLAWLSGQDDMDELRAADRLEAFRAEGEHFRGLSFPTIAGAGANGAIVHYRSGPDTNRSLIPGALFLLDSGAQYLDGTTDVTRTIAVGKPDPQQIFHFTLVLKGHIAIARAVFPEGTTGSQLDVLARRALWAHGLDYDHGTGHGVGSFLSVHEGPQRISKSGIGAIALRAGMILSNEPGYYRQGAYGIRIEALVAVVEAPPPAGAERTILGFETLTLVPIDRSLIDCTLLDGDEIAWIDAYHARTAAQLMPLLNDKTAQDWLARAVAPLDADC